MRVIRYFAHAHPGQSLIVLLCPLLSAVVEALQEPILPAFCGFGA